MRHEDVFLTTTLVHSTPGERAATVHCIGTWLGARVGLDEVQKQVSPLYWHESSVSSVTLPVASRCTDCAIQVVIMRKV
jgi:hypothetical protein